MAARTNVTTGQSFNKAAKRIEEWARQSKFALGPALRIAGEEIMTDVKAARPGKGVPVDTGALRSTGRVDGPTGTKKKPVVALTFGGAAAQYALVQHERLDYHHEVGEARYLVRGMERFRFDGSRARRSLKANVDAARRKIRSRK